jgi:hypothetical protein
MPIQVQFTQIGEQTRSATHTNSRRVLFDSSLWSQRCGQSHRISPTIAALTTIKHAPVDTRHELNIETPKTHVHKTALHQRDMS